MLTICMPTLNNFQGLDEMIESAEQGDLVPDKYLIIDNSAGKYNSSNPKVEIVNLNKNLGVAASWNYLIRATKEIRVICNDDLLFHKDTLKVLYNFVSNDNEGIMWCPEHNAGNAYSCFVINDKCIDLISYFDETFYPAYYEDCDYARRMLLKGREITKIPNCQYIHVGSRTLNNFSDIEKQYHNETFKANEAYFVRKWGGMPTQEIYSTPFGV